MNEEGDDLVVKLHRECVERRREQKREEREAVEALFRQALERDRETEREEQAFIEQLHREAVEHARRNPPPPRQPPRSVHYTELPEAKPGDPLASEWNTYRREVGRLLAEGQEGRHVLIKGEAILGLFATFEAAAEAGAKQFPGGAYFVHSIRTEEPYLRVRGINYPWPSSISR